MVSMSSRAPASFRMCRVAAIISGPMPSPWATVMGVEVAIFAEPTTIARVRFDRVCSRAWQPLSVLLAPVSDRPKNDATTAAVEESDTLKRNASQHSHYGGRSVRPPAHEAVRLLQQRAIHEASTRLLQEGQMRSVLECRRLLQRDASWRQAPCCIQSAASFDTNASSHH